MSPFKLLTQTKFTWLFWTQFFTSFNDNFLKNALIILIAFKSANIFGLTPEQMVPTAAGVFILPFFLFSATAGEVADKFEKSRLLKIIKCFEIFVMVLAAVGFLTERYPLALGALFCMGLHGSFFSPVKYSILPQLLESDELIGGNAAIEAGTFLGVLLGTMAGGFLITRYVAGPLIVSVGLIFFALLGFLTSTQIPMAPSFAEVKINRNPMIPAWQNFRQACRNPSVLFSLLSISWFWFFGTAVLSLFPSYGKSLLHVRESVVTLFIALFSIGVGVGSFICERLSRQKINLWLVLLGAVGMSLFMIDLFFIGRPVFSHSFISLGIQEFIHYGDGRHISLDLLGMAVFCGLYIVPLYTLIQKKSESAFRARIMSANNMVNALFMVLGALLLIFLNIKNFTIPQTFLILGLLNGFVGLLIFLTMKNKA